MRAHPSDQWNPTAAFLWEPKARLIQAGESPPPPRNNKHLPERPQTDPSAAIRSHPQPSAESLGQLRTPHSPCSAMASSGCSSFRSSDSSEPRPRSFPEPRGDKAGGGGGRRWLGGQKPTPRRLSKKSENKMFDSSTQKLETINMQSQGRIKRNSHAPVCEQNSLTLGTSLMGLANWYFGCQLNIASTQPHGKHAKLPKKQHILTDLLVAHQLVNQRIRFFSERAQVSS